MNKTAKFIVDCCDKGITNFGDIVQYAKSLVSEIDVKLKAADGLRIERVALLKILSELGDDVSRNKNTDLPSLNFNDNSDDAVSLRAKICETIEASGPITNRELMQKVGNYSEDAKIIHAIKYLGIAEIIRRDGTPENKILPGPKWNER